jgi:hypothetical protein
MVGVGIQSSGVAIGGGPGLYSVDHCNGWVGAAALFDRPTSEDERQSVVDAFALLDGLRSDSQISWALDQVGIPLEHRNLSEGIIFMGPANTKDVGALEFIRLVTATEGGDFYVDHRDEGKLRFTNRYHRFTEEQSTSSQYNFSDDPNLSFNQAIRVERDGLEIAPNGIDGLINQVTATWAGGEVIVEDASSVVQFGPRPRQLDTAATEPNQARSAAEWVLARYSQPRFRVLKLPINPGAARTGFFAGLHTMIHDRISYRSHPQATGRVIGRDYFIDGVEHSVERGLDWQTSYRLAPADTFTPWMWGISAWDTETYWG